MAGHPYIRLRDPEQVVPWAKKLIDDLSIQQSGGGSAGPQGPQGPAGAPGADGAPGAAGAPGVGAILVPWEFPTIVAGTTITLAQVPLANSELIYAYGKLLKRVASSPGQDEYTISGAVVTTGWALVVGDDGNIWTHYYVSGGTPVGWEFPTITNGASSFTLAHVPRTKTEQIWAYGKALKRVTAGPGQDEYTISGNVVTTGWTLVTADQDEIWAAYTY